MGFLSEIRKALFGAKAASRSVRASGRQASEDLARQAKAYLDDDIPFREEDQAPAEPSPTEAAAEAEHQPAETEADLFAEASEAIDQPEDEPEAPLGASDELDELFADEEDTPDTEAEASEETPEDDQSERLRHQAEDLGETILKKGNDALDGARSLADRIFDKANDLVDRAQREAAEELEKKVQAAKDLEKELEEEKKAAASRKSIFDTEDEDLLSDHDDFFERARRFADGDYQNEGSSAKHSRVDIKKDPEYKSPKKEGRVPGFEDLDGDGDEIIDDAIIDDTEDDPHS